MASLPSGWVYGSGEIWRVYRLDGCTGAVKYAKRQGVFFSKKITAQTVESRLTCNARSSMTFPLKHSVIIKMCGLLEL
jgi:hypothetical protein